MPKILVSGKGGSGKSTLITLLARELVRQGKRVLVVDADESNLTLHTMLDARQPQASLLDYLGGKPAVGKKLSAVINSQGNEKISLFEDKLTFDQLPPQCVEWEGGLGLVRVGKIEHSNEGCACPMGAVARNFLNQLEAHDDQWVLVDTEAGVEHFGRGVLEGVETVLMVVDPSHESVLLADKASGLAGEAGKRFLAVLNRVDDISEPVLRRELEKRGIPIGGMLQQSPGITSANLQGKPVDGNSLSQGINRIIGHL